MNLNSKALASLITMVCALSFAACGSDADVVASASEGSDASAATEATAPVGQLSDDEIVGLVTEVASNFGEDEPEQVAWVRAADRNGPAELIRGEGTVVATPEENGPVVVVSARGEFQPPPGPSFDAESPVRAALYLSIDEETGEVLDTSVTDTIADLSPLGDVHSAATP